MRWSVLLVFALGACDPAEPRKEHLPLEIFVSAGLNDQLSAFAVSLVKNGSSLDCATVRQQCIKDQVEASRFVTLTDADGQPRESLWVTLALSSGTPRSTQDLSLRELPLGNDLLLVIEAATKDVRPRLAGSACTPIAALTRGENTPVVARIETLGAPVNCDPRH